mgnify:FL=1
MLRAGGLSARSFDATPFDFSSEHPLKRGLTPPEIDLREAVRNAWKTNNRVNVYLIEQLPAALWDVPVPEAPRRTVRSIAAHIHNSRCWWIKLLGAEIGIARPEGVDRWTVKRKELAAAPNRSGRRLPDLLMAGCVRGGRIPASAASGWRNLPL